MPENNKCNKKCNYGDIYSISTKTCIKGNDDNCKEKYKDNLKYKHINWNNFYNVCKPCKYNEILENNKCIKCRDDELSRDNKCNLCSEYEKLEGNSCNNKCIFGKIYIKSSDSCVDGNDNKCQEKYGNDPKYKHIKWTPEYYTCTANCDLKAKIGMVKNL